jgi:Zn-dependent peptidase ImmA (M78 family)
MDFHSISVPTVTGLSHAQIEKEALGFLKLTAAACLEKPQPTPILEIFENKMDLLDFQILVGKNVKGLGGFTDVTHRYIELPNSTYHKLEKGVPQAKFTVAHEFGHACLHGKNQNYGAFPSREHLVFARRGQLRAFEDPEWQANNFASAILMPAKTMWSLYRQQQMTPENVMDIYQVSWSAATRRVLRLNPIFQGC